MLARYADVLVAQFLSAGAERWREAVMRAPLWEGERRAYAGSIAGELHRAAGSGQVVPGSLGRASGGCHDWLDCRETRLARGRGVIVQVGSALAHRAIPLQAAYCGAKHAVRGFTDAHVAQSDAEAREDAARRDFREMHEAGVELLIGSDAAVLNIYPGYSLHDEMALFVREFGMTPAEVIERATRRSAKFLGISDQTGTVERGKMADLVLLDANPLDDIRNTRRIAAVILRGTLYDKGGLERILAAVRGAPDRRTDDWGRTSSARNRN